MIWQQLSFHTTKDKADFLSELLFAAGATSVSYADEGNSPVYEPQREKENLWDKTTVQGIFTGDVSIPTVLEQCRIGFGEDSLPPHTLENLPEQVWERAWMSDFKPLYFGGNLWICPTWCEPPDAKAVNLRLDPGLAFGSGTHATTALCLEYLALNPPKNLKVIDYGCGCGILALASLKLGAEKLWAIDNDKDALDATRENAKQNAIPDKQLFCGFPEELRPMKVDLLLANILCEPLCSLASHFAELVKPNGTLVLSGILSHQIPEILQHYKQWFSFEEPTQKEEWIRLIARKKP